ncbi:MFS transporter [Streptomyces sp. NPDC086023]|uniref:MFS transporter n=1 Tax=Streptomyces sp. NPDC086023 TaxID=3365746 RepID=UPI0037D22506
MGLTIAPLVLLLSERGMTVAAVAGLLAAHSLTAAVLELPTGGLSDVLGRRAVLAAAGLLNLTALLLLALGTTGWVLAAGTVLMGAARALSSGPAEAWYVDTVQAADPDAELRTGLARGSAATSAALAAGTLLGGALPWLLGHAALPGPVLPLSVPPLLGAAGQLVFVLYVLTALREPPRAPATAGGVLRGIPATVAAGLRLGGRDRLVRRVLLAAAAAGSGLAALELLTPGRAAALTGAPESGAALFAGLACTGFLCSAAGSHLAPLAARLTGSGERAVLAGLAAGAGGLVLLGVTATAGGPAPAALALTGYGLVYLGFGIAGPNENELLHGRVPSAGRATALSVQSLALQLAGALTGLVVSALPAGPGPWLLAAAVLLAGALLWVRPAARRTPDTGSIPGPATTGTGTPGTGGPHTGTTGAGPGPAVPRPGTAVPGPESAGAASRSGR